MVDIRKREVISELKEPVHIIQCDQSMFIAKY